MHRGNFVRQLLAASRYRWPNINVDVPLLLLASAQDRMVNPVCSVALQAAARAALQMHPNANHDLPLDAPEWTAEQIAVWRSGLSTSPWHEVP
jgi:pimeloyl-ACP methyl ester carboxylesterase